MGQKVFQQPYIKGVVELPAGKVFLQDRKSPPYLIGVKLCSALPLAVPEEQVGQETENVLQCR